MKRGSLRNAKLFCKPDWRNKDDILLVTMRFITVDLFQYVLLYLNCDKSV
jgi:hypothetical protein